MFTIKNRARIGVSYLVLLAVYILVTFLIRPISDAVNAGAFPFTAWFYGFINNFTSYTLWLFVFGGLISLGYIRGKGNEKFDIVFGLIAIYTMVWFLVVSINDIFSTALTAGAIGKLRGSSVGARAYDWAGFVSGLLMLSAGTYFFFNAKFLGFLKDFFKEILGLSAHGEKVQAKWEDVTFGKKVKFENKEKGPKGEVFSEEEVEDKKTAPSTVSEETTNAEVDKAPRTAKKKPAEKAPAASEDIANGQEEASKTAKKKPAEKAPVASEDVAKGQEEVPKTAKPKTTKKTPAEKATVASEDIANGQEKAQDSTPETAEISNKEDGEKAE